MKIELTQYGKWLPADVQTPISLYLGLVGDAPGILLESAEVDGRLGRYSLIAWDFRLSLTPVRGKLSVECADSRLAGLAQYSGMDFLEGLRAVMKSLHVDAQDEVGPLPAFTRGLYGTLGYGLAGMLEPKLADKIPAKDAEVRLVLPGRAVLFDHLKHRCCFLSLDEGAEPEFTPQDFTNKTEPTVVGEPTVSPGREKYIEGVKKVKDLIAEGECIQVVLSTRFSAPFAGDSFNLYRRLRQANPSPFMFYMKFSREEILLGSSPEMMARCERGRLEVRPIAGTRLRGVDAAGDLKNSEELLADPKERAEHVMLVDLGRNDLGRIAKAGTVTVEKFMQVEYFSHVMHLTSYVEADLRDDHDAIDVLQATFPAGTLSGAPKIRAMEIISEIEEVPRGPYGGAIGFIGLDKDSINLDTGITIRSMWIRDGKCHWQAGAGIVYDSIPEMEWEECNNKARVLREILQSEGGDVFAC
ncbi:anthranilate synthase component I family protein [Maridesulfovibrio frigidus]|uniref:anthranilate synthase component I family protein n=1 Tax=Maridesulfovibrio frigidus TaxID=340956 RepID=UPI0004E263B8|nr:anthranilate synthase component I family protein [Maridesulfovibrio frigidus]